MPSCTRCGTELKLDAKFCHKCGKMVAKEKPGKKERALSLTKDKATSEIIAELQALKSKILRIPQIYPTRAKVTGANTAKKEIPAVCQVIDDAIRALQTGLDIYDKPITKPQIAAGLKRLVDQTRRPLWVGSTSLAISVQGIFEVKKYMNKLEEIASKIEPRLATIKTSKTKLVTPVIPPRDESILSGESMSKVESKDDLRPGDVIRVWNRWTRSWIPGWWCEVLRVEGNRVYLRDLKSGEEKSRPIDHWLLGTSWKHPNPERAKAMGLREGGAERERLQKLKSQYNALDFSASTEDEMATTLRRELQWRDSHDSQYYYMKEEFEIREVAIRKIGEELNKRGGKQLMLQMFKRVQGTRSLEMIWDGIGDWRG